MERRKILSSVNVIMHSVELELVQQTTKTSNYIIQGAT